MPKKFMFFDTETTGLDPMTGDKIIEIALLTYDADSRTLIDKFVQRFDPERSISPKAQEVHGITYDELVGQPKFAYHAEAIQQRFLDANLIVAHNLSFDAGFLLCELSAAGFKLPDRPSIDTMEQGRWACPDGKFPKLGELCFALDIPYNPDEAHSAEYDVIVMANCLFRGLDLGFYTIPEAC